MSHDITILRSTVSIGLDAPVRFLHLIDSHICLGFV